jgi:(S)-3,5-dihydroxyphenylglycine transaminase
MDRHGVVVYLGTFSKLLFPALRIGFLVADQRVLSAGSGVIRSLAEELSKVKSFTTVTTSALLQAIVGGILLEANYSLREYVKEKVAFCRSNRDLMLVCLERHFHGDPLLADRVSWNRPGGGFFLSMHLPFAFTKERMQACAERYGVICCPMTFFSLLDKCEDQVRLSFSSVSHEQIEQGIAQFWQFVHDIYAMELQETVRD